MKNSSLKRLLKQDYKNNYFRVFILFFIFTCSNTSLFSQSLKYTNFNLDNGFPTNTIYDIAMQNDGYLYLATDIGIFKFDGSKAILIPQKNIGGNISVTNFQKDSFGNLYSLSFSNQILKISNDSIKQVIDWKNRFKSGFIHFTMDATKNEIWISSDNNYLFKYNLVSTKVDSFRLSLPKHNLIKGQNNIYLVTRNKVYFTINIPNEKNVIGYLDKTSNKTILLKSKSVNKLGLTKGFFIKKDTNILYINNWKYGKNKFYSVRNDSLIPFKAINKSIGTKRVIKANFYQDKLLVCSENGLLVLDSSYNKKMHILKDLEVSNAMLKDNALWVSTLNNGLYYFPDIEIKTYRYLQLKHKNAIQRLLTDQNKVYVATEKGEVFIKNNSNKLIPFYRPTETEKISNIFEYNKWNKHFYLNLNDKLVELDANSNLVSTIPNATNKAISFIKQDIISSSTGGSALYNFNKTDNYPNYFKKEFKSRKRANSSLKSYQLFNERSICNAYNSTDSSIWIGSINNLYRIGKEGVDALLFNDKPIYAYHICTSTNGNTFIATSNGVLEFNKKKIINQFTTENGLIANKINIIRSFEEHLYIITNHGLQQYNINTRKFKTLTKLNGLPSNIITDVVESNASIFIATSFGITEIPLNFQNNNNIPPQLVLSSLLVNEKLVKHKNVSLELDYDTNDIQINLNGVSLKSMGNLTFKYVLKGVNKKYIYEDAKNGEITIRYSDLKPGTYYFIAQVVNENGIESKRLILILKIASPYWKTWWFYALMVLGTLLTITGFIYIRIELLKRKNLLEKKVIASEITALKSQMNPHFIFNALNSIQSLILKKDIRKSNVYLGKFSTLVREVLEVSAKDSISLEQEIKILEVYLDLEALRFEENFTSQTSINDTLNPSQLYLPPLIIQPYVENAIKHGLLHLETNRELTIQFLDANDRFECIITDNGIGREASKKINQKKPKYHKPFASKANEERIDLVNSFLEHKILLNIIDLKQGTKVILSFYKNE